MDTFKKYVLPVLGGIAALVVIVAGVLFAIQMLRGGSASGPAIAMNSSPDGSTYSAVEEWYDQTGHADNDNPASIRLIDWIPPYVTAKHNATVTHYEGWFQAKIGENLIMSCGEFAGAHTLSGIEGLNDGDPVYVAMRDIAPWVDEAEDVYHYEWVGSYIPNYRSSIMGGWNVDNSTICQFDGADPKSFMDIFAADWLAERIAAGEDIQ